MNLLGRGLPNEGVRRAAFNGGVFIMAPNLKDKNNVIKYTSLFVLVLQNTSLVLFMRYAMTGNRPKFLKAISVFFAEIFKFVASVVLVCLQERSVVKGFTQIYDQFVHHWRDALKVLVPAVVYTIQNFLLYVAVENLPAATYMVTYQLKILTTAVFTVLVLGRKLSIQQWVSLFFLFGGVAIVQYDQKMSNDREKAERLAAAMADDISTTVMPTIEDAFTKLMGPATDVFNGTTLAPAALGDLTRSKREVHEQNSIIGFIAVLDLMCPYGFGTYQLALPSIFFALLFAFVKDNTEIFADGIAPEAIWRRMLFGFDWAVWVTIAISAFGGLVVAVVIKFADNILKAFATSFAIVLNCILAYFLFNFRPTMFFVVGACFVIGAVFVYSIYPYRVRREPVPTCEEMVALKEKNDKGEV
ncbi:UDP-galactose transporter [Trichostrongylus colubriformis]|uniref:UDP-galactose transporter n=1 Tax=Trichostrongylus colubriformis TaxID=6319 RepID=A0AAN8FTE6_TRICO